MKLPKELTTITSLSKYFAMILFIALPFIGFLLGIKYQEMIDLIERQELYNNLAPIARSPTPTPENTNELRTYTNTKYNYSFKYPSFYEPYSVGGGVILNRVQSDGYPGFPNFYLNILPNNEYPGNIAHNGDSFTNNIEKYLSTKVGETISPPDQPWEASFVRLADINIDGVTALVFESYAYGKPSLDGLKDRRIIISRGKSIYMIGTYYSKKDSYEWNLYDQILSTFQFAN